MENIENTKPSRRRYLSLGEKKYNNQLKSLEKNLIKRLYKLPKKNKKIEQNEILPSLEGKKEIDFGDKLKNNMLLNIASTPNFSKNRTMNKKNLSISLNDNLDNLFKQTQQINKYEMLNKARRSNNESEYNIYKNGKIGCRLKTLNSMNNLPFNHKKNYAMKRFNTEGNKVFPNRMQKMKIEKNKFGFPNQANIFEKEKI